MIKILLSQKFNQKALGGNFQMEKYVTKESDYL
jgi:hypothetical protein